MRNSAVSGATWTATQGIARDAAQWYAIGTIELRSYNLTDTLQDTNSSPFTGLPAGVDHMGDGFSDGTYLYVPVVDWDSGTQTSSSQVIAKYNVSDLSLDSYFDISAQSACGGSGLCLSPDESEIYVTSFYSVSGSDARNTDVYRFNKTTGAFIGVLTLGTPSVGIQSITFHSDSNFYIGSFDPGTSPDTNTIYVYDSSLVLLTVLDPIGSGDEMEGVESYDGTLYYNEILDAPREAELVNVYISNNEAASDPLQFLDNSLISDNATILMRVTPNSLFNFNAIFDNLSYSNDWECWIYATGELAFRVDSSNRTSTFGIVAGQEYVFAFTWARSGGSVTVKTGVDGTYGSDVAGSWVTPPSGGLWLGGENPVNTQGDSVYPDVLVFDKVLSVSEFSDAAADFQDFYIEDSPPFQAAWAHYSNIIIQGNQA